MHAVARHGVSGAAGSYPYADRIREAFGRYAPAGLRAHFGPAAREAGAALSAEAFVWNGEAAFAERPSLRTAAHEAAHLVDQAAGVDLRHGVGARGDARERLADRVADTVAAGRSAEPVFAAALEAQPPSVSGAPALQMLNKITNHDGPAMDSPWKEIQDQLSVKPGVIQNNLRLTSPRFAKMVDTLGDSCDRANWVEARVGEGRPGPPRSNDDTQFAYGALGSFMSFVTGTNTAPKMEFEGGHLISDELVGLGSYKQWNFAPQRGHINAPIYRKIEELAGPGPVTALKDPKLTTPKPTTTMRAEVKYLPGKVKLATPDVMLRLSLTPADLTTTTPPADVNLTHRVPWLWSATIDAGHDDYVFDVERTVDTSESTDPLKRTGAAFGFLPKESEVEAYQPKASTHIDANLWSMDTMSHAVLGQPATTRGTGSGTDRKRIHTFKAVQSVPTGSNLTLGSVSAPLSPPKPVPALTLKHSWSFSEFEASALTGPWAKKNSQAMAATLQSNEPDFAKYPKSVLAEAAVRIQFAKQEHARGQKRKREDHLKQIKDKRAKVVFDTLSKNITNATNTGPVWP